MNSVVFTVSFIHFHLFSLFARYPTLHILTSDVSYSSMLVHSLMVVHVFHILGRLHVLSFIRNKHIGNMRLKSCKNIKKHSRNTSRLSVNNKLEKTVFPRNVFIKLEAKYKHYASLK